MKIINKVLFTTVLISLFFIADIFAQLAPVDSVIEGNINTSAFLTKNKRYLLRGFVNVNPPATLTIEAGTIIYGEKSSKGTLIINRGARLIANGTAQSPIVFTSQQPIGQRGPGDWGGIIIAGNATINVPGGTAIIEGGTGTVYGGGANPNDNDNSGILRYVRIEFPGIAFLPDNEINGLTLGGVGRGTTIEYVQVSFCGDDSFEWFGGTVDAKYLISFKGIDDDFDMDLGYRGNLQFGFGLRDPNLGDISGSNGFEIDNDGTGSFNVPRTLPVISNFTVVGPMPDTSTTGYNPNFRRGAHLRRATQSSIYNSIVMGFPTGLLLDGSAVANAATGDTLQIRNSIWAGLRVNNGITTNVSGFNATNWFNTATYGNRTFVQPSGVGLTAPFNLTNPNPLPATGSAALSGASFANPRLGSFFTQTTYVGAFGTTRWDLPWANYDPQNTNYTSVKEDLIDVNPTDFYLSQNYPNPFNPSTKIMYSVAKPSKVKLYVTNVIGQVVEVLVDEFKDAGTYELTFNAENLATGLYIYTLEADNVKLSKKMTLVK
ncbi:MAG: T9SS type A sorting domain-containing protein [Ignavibacterium sp.]|nr:T9SS type A sorting domain-containing protein [Ignavibacterium sp.]MDW8376176.1 T9SS type A sorting domain-containing protein [Ignavibacteriales bacterium]